MRDNELSTVVDVNLYLNRRSGLVAMFTLTTHHRQGFIISIRTSPHDRRFLARFKQPKGIQFIALSYKQEFIFELHDFFKILVLCRKIIFIGVELGFQGH